MAFGPVVLCVVVGHPPTAQPAVNLTYATRPEPTHRTTPASAYAREARMLTRYRELLYDANTDVEALMAQVWGPNLTERQKWGNDGTDGRVDRLDYNVPDLLQRLKWDEQAEAEALLLEGNLLGCIRWVLAKERTLLQRENDPRLLLNDDWRLKAAGLGRLGREAYGHPLGEPLVLTPAPIPRLSVSRRGKRQAVRYHHLPSQLTFWP